MTVLLCLLSQSLQCCSVSSRVTADFGLLVLKELACIGRLGHAGLYSGIFETFVTCFSTIHGVWVGSYLLCVLLFALLCVAVA